MLNFKKIIFASFVLCIAGGEQVIGSLCDELCMKSKNSSSDNSNLPECNFIFNEDPDFKPKFDDNKDHFQQFGEQKIWRVECVYSKRPVMILCGLVDKERSSFEAHPTHRAEIDELDAKRVEDKLMDKNNNDTVAKVYRDICSRKSVKVEGYADVECSKHF